MFFNRGFAGYYSPKKCLGQQQSIAPSSLLINIISILFCLLLMSCSSAYVSSHSHAATAQPTRQTPKVVPLINKPVTTTGCGHASSILPGSTATQTISSDPTTSYGSSSRTYRIHISSKYQNNRLEPLILIFHGHGGSATGMESSTGFSKLADQQQFIAVYPQGLVFTDDATFWASVGTIDGGIDDLLFVSNILNDVQNKFCIDPHRIFATGFSNGGGMVGYLACSLAKRVAAFAPVSGNFYALPGGCNPGRPVPILDIHGTEDTIVPYKGISARINPAWPLPSIPQWLQDWASRNGCNDNPITFSHTSDMTAKEWQNCQQNATIIQYRMDGGGHTWPSTLGSHTSIATMWSFFQAHPLQ